MPALPRTMFVVVRSEHDADGGFLERRWNLRFRRRKHAPQDEEKRGCEEEAVHAARGFAGRTAAATSSREPCNVSEVRKMRALGLECGEKRNDAG